MKVLVCGDRHWADRPLLFVKLDELVPERPEAVIEGCARGADAAAEEWALAKRYPLWHFPADWNKFGKAAGLVRNRLMLQMKPNLVIAFHPDLAKSKGTADMVRIARRAGVLTIVVSE